MLDLQDSLDYRTEIKEKNKYIFELEELFESSKSLLKKVLALTDNHEAKEVLFDCLSTVDNLNIFVSNINNIYKKGFHIVIAGNEKTNLLDDLLKIKNETSNLNKLVELQLDIEQGVAINIGTTLEKVLEFNTKMLSILKGLNKISGHINTINLAEEVKKNFEEKQKILNIEKHDLEDEKRKFYAKPTGGVYDELYKYNRGRARFFESGFLLIICIGFGIYDLINTLLPYDSLEVVKSLLPRLFFLSTFILIITFFLRRASQYRKISQQAQQTSLELEALPLFVRGLREEDRYDIYKDLAGKYFGQKVDQTQNDKVADLIQDQAKISIDIAKATTEMVKSLKDVQSKKSSENNT